MYDILVFAGAYDANTRGERFILGAMMLRSRMHEGIYGAQWKIECIWYHDDFLLSCDLNLLILP